MGTITQGKFTGSSQAFKSRKTTKLGSGLTLGAQRKQDLEAKAINDKRSQEQAKAKEISRREKERKAMQSDLQKRVASEENNPNRNTDERRKVVNVGRPDTAKNPMDTRAKLVKQAEIKNKIIEDQEKSMTLQKYHNLPDDLVAAVRAVLEGKNPFAKKDDDDKKKPSKKDDDDVDDKDTKAKKSDDDEEDDDDADKPVGKSGKKTKVDIEPNMKTANEELKGKQHKLDKNHNGKLDKQDFKMLRKEEAENLDELSNKTLRSYSVASSRHLHDIKPAWIRPADYEKGAAVGAHGKTAQKRAQGLEKAGEKIKQNIAKTNASMKEEVEEIDEGIVKKIKRGLRGWGTLSDAKPKDIMNRVKSADDDLLNYASKSDAAPHSPAGLQKAAATRELKRRQKNTNEEIALSDEETARILAKLNEAKGDDDEDHQDGPEHIVMQLRKAKSLGANNRPIHFHDGSKVKVHAAHVQKALDMHGSFKKAPEKDEFTQKLQASHASFKKAIGEK